MSEKSSKTTADLTSKDKSRGTATSSNKLPTTAQNEVAHGSKAGTFVLCTWLGLGMKPQRKISAKLIWLRATGSTAVSQLIDSFVVLYIAFVLGPQKWPTSQFLAVGTVNYAYKMLAAIALIPLLYVARRLIRARISRSAGQGRI